MLKGAWLHCNHASLALLNWHASREGQGKWLKAWKLQLFEIYSDCFRMLMQVLIALLVRGFTCQQPNPAQPLAANVSERDDIVLMSFASKQ